MQPRPRYLVGFYAAIALIMLSELFLSNVGTLIGDLEGTAAMLGLSPEDERNRLLILIVLDAIAGEGALLALWGLLRPNARMIGRFGAWQTAAGLLAYGAYQVYSALLVLAPEWRTPILGVGVLYMLIGALALRLGRPLMAAR